MKHYHFSGPLTLCHKILIYNDLEKENIMVTRIFLLIPQCFHLFPKQISNVQSFILLSAHAFNLDQSTSLHMLLIWTNLQVSRLPYGVKSLDCIVIHVQKGDLMVTSIFSKVKVFKQLLSKDCSQ